MRTMSTVTPMERAKETLQSNKQTNRQTDKHVNVKWMKFIYLFLSTFCYAEFLFEFEGNGDVVTESNEVNHGEHGADKAPEKAAVAGKTDDGKEDNDKENADSDEQEDPMFLLGEVSEVNASYCAHFLVVVFCCCSYVSSFYQIYVLF